LNARARWPLRRVRLPPVLSLGAVDRRRRRRAHAIWSALICTWPTADATAPRISTSSGATSTEN